MYKLQSGASDPSSDRSGQAESSSASTQADEMAEKQGALGDNASGDTAAKESTSHEGASEEVSARKQRNRKARNEDSSDADDNHGGSRKQRNFSKNNHQKMPLNKKAVISVLVALISKTGVSQLFLRLPRMISQN